jgi:cyclopropane-fatty-acyl-phospholipid synthase
MFNLAISLMEKGLLPDFLIRYGIRMNARDRLLQFGSDLEKQQEQVEKFIYELKNSPIAILTEKANEQHYEVPAKFFTYVLGKNLKYSSCYYQSTEDSLNTAEDRMLEITCQRAELTDGQSVLELGCGWGSLTLWMAKHYPNSKITAVSNSKFQREFILEQAKNRGLSNVEIITADMNQFEIDRKFDRIVSVEMFEHMRNYSLLFDKITKWMKDDAKLFVHIFCHKFLAYPYETEGADNWMGKYFFTGGIMPSKDLLLRFPEYLKIEKQWVVNGQHYQKTSEDWLRNLDNNKDTVMNLFKECYESKEANIWFQRWRVFFLACAEVFGYEKGNQWFVTHMLFSK